MNYIYLSLKKQSKKTKAYISQISDELNPKKLYVSLTDEELREACEETLIANVRFIFTEGYSKPTAVILVKDGEECNDGKEEDEYCLDDLISNYFDNSDSE